MAERTLRRGLPRVAGGEPWPAALTVEVADDAAASVAESVVAEPAPAAPAQSSSAPSGPAAPVVEDAVAAAPVTPAAPAAAGTGVALRRGLPRVAGGEAWPPAGTASAAAAAPVSAAAPSEAHAPAQAAPAAAPAAPTTAAAPAAFEDGAALRRGLPRVAGGDPWPPAGAARVRVAPAEPVAEAAPAEVATTAETAGTAVAAPAAAAVATVPAVVEPLRFPRTVWQGTAPKHIRTVEEEGRRRPSWPQAISGLLGAAALGLIAAAAIAFVRAFLTLPFMQDFLAAFPGEYHPAIEVAPGFAPWIGWQHFFNMFLMVLIIRSGIQVRREKRPTAFWTPKNDAKGKVSLNIWFHQALDVLWLVNGVIFVVLLFVTGHWVRIVPTSWEVFPNALSAALQYVSFDWPTENGWANYNSLQQLAYFATVFLAAPLAAVTGFRMSGMWPRKAEKLSKAYPIEWARAVHFPVMIYFVLFIIAHVALVFLTGMLRNLNHMFASNDTSSWVGFWVFVAAMVAIIGGWIAARPLVIAPIARLFGTVSSR